MAVAEGEFPRPPGFEDSNDVNEAELDEFLQFMGSSKDTAPAPSAAPSAKPDLGDNRGLARGRGPQATSSAPAAVASSPPPASLDLGDNRGLGRGRGVQAAAPAPAAATSSKPDIGDDRGFARGRGRQEGAGYAGVEQQPAPVQPESQPSRPPGIGLIGEETASLEVTPWRESGDVAPDPALSLLDEDATFESLGLNDQIVQGIYMMGFVKPSKIQAAALPLLKDGTNMIGQAQNGSGKTATFSLALLRALDIADERPQAVCVCPTRELAKQNESVISQLGCFLPVKTFLALPKEPANPNARCHVIVGTPGKILELTKKRLINVSVVKVFVLDEADMMLDQEKDMGPQVTQIRKFMPQHVQVLFFSATYPDNVRAFAETLVPRAISIKVKKTDLTVASVAQTYLRCKDEWDKFNKLKSLYGAMNIGQSVVFVNQRKRAFDLAKWMRDEGFAVSLICGTQATGEERMDPHLRDQVMDEFRNNVTRVLIATDVLSRGIDVPQVTLVVNYELPKSFAERGMVDMETYLHRIGRTGRFGLKGLAVNLVTDRERPSLDQICSFFECSIEEVDEDFDALEEKAKMLR